MCACVACAATAPRLSVLRYKAGCHVAAALGAEVHSLHQPNLTLVLLPQGVELRRDEGMGKARFGGSHTAAATAADFSLETAGSRPAPQATATSVCCGACALGLSQASHHLLLEGQGGGINLLHLRGRMECTGCEGHQVCAVSQAMPRPLQFVRPGSTVHDNEQQLDDAMHLDKAFTTPRCMPASPQPPWPPAASPAQQTAWTPAARNGASWESGIH